MSNAGIFMAFSAFSFLSFSIVSPIVSSNADTNTASVTVGPYTTSISADTTTAIDITPTPSQAVYTGTNTITYTNTCPYGFNVTASTASADTNLTRSGTDSGVKIISSTTGTTLVDNSWGISTDGGTTYIPVPAISSPINVLNTFTATNNPATLNLMYGVKTDNSLPSGNYTNDIVYTVSVKPQCLFYGITWDYDGGTATSGVTYPTELNFGATIDLSTLTPTKSGYIFTGWSNGIDTFTGAETSVDINTISSSSLTMTAQWQLIQSMQDFSCDTLNLGSSILLRDARDNKTYTVKKLDDGRCWMTENLGIVNKTISSADSDLPSGTTYTIPASDLSGFTDFNTSNAYYDSEKGGYYNFYTATAGWGTNTITSGESPMSICPKGWRLPTSGEYSILYSKYNSSALLRGVPGFIVGGYIDNGAFLGTNEGRYWSSTVYMANNVYGLYFNDGSSASPSTSLNKYRGNPVHCIVDETMQGYNTTQLANTGDAIVLTDTRDGNKYTVKKLADGKVWMTENLRIVDKTISSADSNLPAGDTFTIQSISGERWSNEDFQEVNYSKASYSQSTNSGYYNFYTATAGWGSTETATSGNAPKDICPKGWKLPSADDFDNLYSYYSSSPNLIITGDPKFTMTGMNNGNQGTGGMYYSSSVIDERYVKRAVVSESNGLSTASQGLRFNGYTLRCLVK